MFALLVLRQDGPGISGLDSATCIPNLGPSHGRGSMLSCPLGLPAGSAQMAMLE